MKTTNAENSVVNLFNPGEFYSNLRLNDFSKEEASNYFKSFRKDISERIKHKDALVALSIENTAEHAILMLACLSLDLKVFLYHANTPRYEVERRLNSLPSSHELFLNGNSFLVTEHPSTIAEEEHPEPGIYLATSGSTGLPKFVFRSLSSLITEGRRYVELLQLNTEHKVLLPLPFSHSYALGWMFGAFLADCALRLVEPTDLGSIEKFILEHHFTVLTPNIARLLGLRGKPIETSRAVEPRVAMVGAGPVENSVNQLFEQKYGIHLSRNYGSTETGAVFASVAVRPERDIGQPMPNIRYKIESERTELTACTETGVLREGTLYVQLENGDWHNTEDLCQESEVGLKIIGRKTKSIRRGDKWISPIEIEQALKLHTNVIDAQVYAKSGRNTGDDRIIAKVWVHKPTDSIREDLFLFARSKLGSGKTPDEIQLSRSLIRNSIGKFEASPKLYINQTELLKKARAYKVSHLIFALFELDVFSQMSEPFTIDELLQFIQIRYPSISLNEVEVISDILLSSKCLTKESKSNSNMPDFESLLSLERHLVQNDTSIVAIDNVLQNGIKNRQFEQAQTPSELLEKYNKAMFGDFARFRTYRALPLLNLSKDTRFLEVSAGKGNYAEIVAARYKNENCSLFSFGNLAPKSTNSSGVESISQQALLDQEFDTCVLSNSIHSLQNHIALNELIKHLSPNGRLLIDDIFYSKTKERDMEIAIDWLTHGGIDFIYIEELEALLNDLGLKYETLVSEEDAMHHQLLIKI